MDHDHDHHHHHVNMANKANMVMNNAQHLLQQQTTTRSAHSGHGSHAKDMMMMVMSIQFPLIETDLNIILIPAEKMFYREMIIQ